MLCNSYIRNITLIGWSEAKIIVFHEVDGNILELEEHFLIAEEIITIVVIKASN